MNRFCRLFPMSLCLFVFALASCTEEAPTKTELQSSLKDLQRAKDSVSKMHTEKQYSVFRLELEQPTDTVTNNYDSLQREVKQLEMQVKWLEQKIENTQELLYKPE